MANFNIENLVINRVVRASLLDKANGDVIVSFDQISDPSLECSGEQVFANDALGQKIAAFDRSKDATFSGSNALINFGLMAAQLGTEKKLGTSENKIIVPRFELIDVRSKATTVELAHTPAEGSLKKIYSTHKDKSKDKAYGIKTSADASSFSLAGKTITLPTGFTGDRIAVWYESEEVEAFEVVNSTQKFAKGGRFIVEILAADVCDVNTEYYAYLIFENAKFDNNFTVDFNSEASHAFSVQALQDYCSTDNRLFTIVVAED